MDNDNEKAKELDIIANTCYNKTNYLKGAKLMRCTLMHKNIPVVDLDIDSDNGFIKAIVKEYNLNHLPVGVAFSGNHVNCSSLNTWWSDRSIPASRSGISAVLEKFNFSSTKALLTRCFGLSLSDQYWIKPIGADIKWSEINFFENEFSEDIGDVLFGTFRGKDNVDFDFSSPDNTSDGCLKKRWKIINGKRCLIKGGSGTERQQPFNEVIATKIMQRLGIPHVPYSLVWDNDEPYSICEDFVSAETELIPAWRVMQTKDRGNSTSVYQHFLDCCTDLGAGDMIPDLDRMIVLDYIIANEDRHLNNFGLLRNAETLEWLGFAPIYDSGSSLWYDKRVSQINQTTDIICKPFKRKHKDQIKLVSDFSWIDFEKINDIPEFIVQFFSDEKIQDFVSESRAKAISILVANRIQTLQNVACGQMQKTDIISKDVSENVATEYK